ncbi:hypothetical protein [Acinetobacter seifertii]|uniref:hypothetical protein n=1 Tax=Acinetobacter seifertii TaxID=1530123 RepID=UPI0032B3D989
MTACPSCNEELNNEYLDSVMDKLSYYKDSVLQTEAEQCPNCQKEIIFKKLALSYYLINGDKEILIGGA